MLEKLALDTPDFTGRPLGGVYAEGKVAPRDLIKAYISSGRDEEKKVRLSKQMISAQIKEAVERSWNWQQQHHPYRPGYRSSEDYDFWRYYVWLYVPSADLAVIKLSWV